MPTGAPVGNPNVAGRPSMSARWWVIAEFGLRGGHSYVAVQSSTKPSTAVAGPFTSKKAADNYITSATGGLFPGGGVISDIGNALNPANWLASIGGGIASGLEAGFVSTLKDIWNVIIGPIEIIIGVLIAAFVLIIYFKNDIMAVATTVGMVAK